MKSMGTQSSYELLWLDLKTGYQDSCPIYGHQVKRLIVWIEHFPKNKVISAAIYIWGNGSILVLFSTDDIIKQKHFSCYSPFVWGIHQSLPDSPHKGQWHRALMFSLICAWTNGWANNRDTGDLRGHHAHYDTTAMSWWESFIHIELCIPLRNSEVCPQTLVFEFETWAICRSLL